MTETTLQMIERIRKMPHTHKVVTTFEDGQVREHTTRSLASAETHADCVERPKIGRNLIVRATGRTVRVVSVEVKEI